MASQRGVVFSENNGGTFSWSFNWPWDNSRDVDFQDGYGWVAVDMWGSRSGPNRIVPGGSWELRRGNIPFSDMSMDCVVVDPLSPGNVVYVVGMGSYRTVDGGEHWISCPPVSFCTVIDGVSVAFVSAEYSRDNGETWLPLGILASAFVKDEATGFIYVTVSSTGGGVSVGRPGSWKPYGLSGQWISEIIVIGDQLLVVSVYGEMFRTKTTNTLSLYRVSLPIILR